MKQPDFWWKDGTELQAFYWGDDMMLHRVHTSLNHEAILAENQAVRNNGGARTLGFGRMVLQIPQDVYFALIKRFPELAPGGDPIERRNAWRRIAQDPAYRNLTVARF